MFSHLSRGYGTWQGIAKLEKPDSALPRGFRNTDVILPPINHDRPPPLYEELQYDYPYHVHTDNIKLPQVQREADIITIPKTYTTKSGALLLYSEGCFVPGSRRMKKRPRLRRRKEKKVQTLKDLTNLIMDYKKNECDPLLLEHLWRKSNYSARDLRPGFSPQRYLSRLLGSATLNEDVWKKLLETGSLKSFGETTDYKGFLPSLVKDGQFNEKLLHQRPQPYTTMSLPPVSPSSSMLGSFTFYKHGMSTGAASMVSTSSVNGDSLDERYSVKTSGTNVESLSERLAEVEPDSGFKQSYESLSPQQKEDLLTQLLMDITLHNAGDLAQQMTQNTPECTTISTQLTNGSTSLSSFGASNLSKSISGSFKSTEMLKSESKSTMSSSFCSLPPIKPSAAEEMTGDGSDRCDGDFGSGDHFDRSSGSGSGLGLTHEDLIVEIDGINIEIVDESNGLGETEKRVLNRKHSDEMSQYSLVGALEIEDGDLIQEWNDEIKSLKSLGDSGRFSHKSGEDGVIVPEDGGHLGSESGGEEVRPGSGQYGDEGMVDDVGQYAGITEGGQEVGVVAEGDGSHRDDEVGNGDVQTGGEYSSGGDGQYGDMTEQDGGQKAEIEDGDISGADSGIAVVITTGDSSGDGGYVDDDHASGGRPDGTLQVPHISLSSLHDEVKQVAGDVLSRPKSGRSLAEDAKMATALLMGRIEGLLGPVITDNIRVSSATPRKLRPLGHPRNSEVNKKSSLFPKSERTVKSAGPSLASRNKPDKTRAVSKEEGEQVDEKPVLSEEKVTPDGTKHLEKNNEDDINLDNITISTDDNKDATTENLEATKDGFLTVTDLKAAEELATEEIPKPPDVAKTKKGQPKKQGKGKKGLTGKKGNVTKAKTKKKGNAKSQVQAGSPIKTPPFHAGLVPQPKPPKGLEVKQEEPKTKVASEDKTNNDQEEKPEIAVEPKEPTPELETPVIRVDSGTGEALDREVVTPAGKTSSTPHSTIEDTSTLGEKTPSLFGTTPSSQLEASSKTLSSFREIESPREETPSSLQEDTSSSPDLTPSPREQTPSPREQTPSPDEEAEAQEHDAANERNKRTNARAAQRAAAAERRRQEVARKRREREEARRKAQEEEARLEQLRIETEAEMKKREEQRRVQREQEDIERKRLEAEERERIEKEKQLVERQKVVRDEWSKKKEQIIAQRKFEEEMRREHERMELEMEEERRREYEQRIAHLEDEERERLMEERRLEEERIKREIEEERLIREEERKRVLDERRRMQEELEAVRQRQLARQTFLESLWKEYSDILLEQRTTRAFTFSYFDYLPWLKERFSDVDERPTSSGCESAREEAEIDRDMTPMQ